MNQLEVIKLNNKGIQASGYNSEDDLSLWANKYYHLHVVNAPYHTQRAKKSDLDKFLLYFTSTLGANIPDLWTPSITKGFQSYLSNHVSSKTGKNYIATSINRILATIKHFASWLHKERPLLGGDPFTGVRFTQVEDPEWNGLSNSEITRLKSACELRMKACKKKHQKPLLEYTIFSTLLSTGLRESELASLNIEQYHSRGFHNVKRKGNKITRKVPVVNEAKELLDRYLATRQDLAPSSPLLANQYNKRIQVRDIARCCERIAMQANTYLSINEKIKLTPHMLRHSFLKRVADKHGLHVAQNLSGNVSIKEIFRYTKPDNNQKHDMVQNLF